MDGALTDRTLSLRHRSCLACQHIHPSAAIVLRGRFHVPLLNVVFSSAHHPLLGRQSLAHPVSVALTAPSSVVYG